MGYFDNSILLYLAIKIVHHTNMFQFYYDQESIYTVSFILKLWNILGLVPYLTLRVNMVTRRIPYIPIQNLGHKIGHRSALLHRITK